MKYFSDKDLSTIIGVSIIVAAVVGILVGRISDGTFEMMLGAAAPLVGLGQYRPVTTINTVNTTVHPAVEVTSK